MIQEPEQRRVYYDQDLQIEAYNLSGIVQKFPNHFHKYYVLGFVEGGRRHLWCRNQEYDVSAGDLILFNPKDNHCCAPIDGEPPDYRAVNIQTPVMEKEEALFFLLEQGIPPVDAAAMAGFSDQSHFTNFFKEFIGLTPRQYQKIFLTEPDQPEVHSSDHPQEQKEHHHES